jgi:hypothetical protein
MIVKLLAVTVLIVAMVIYRHDLLALAIRHPRITNVIWWAVMIWMTYDLLFEKGPFKYKGAP